MKLLGRLLVFSLAGFLFVIDFPIVILIALLMAWGITLDERITNDERERHSEKN